MREPVTLRLPEPPSANAYWRSVYIKGRGVVVLLSKEARQYKQDVRAIWLQRAVKDRPCFAGPVRMSLEWYGGAKRGDLSNRIKVAEDALIGHAFVDDKQVAEWSAKRLESPRNPYCLVTIQPIEI